MIFLLQLAAILLGTAGTAAAYGYVTRIDVAGKEYGGYQVDTYPWETDAPKLIAWSTTATDQGYTSEYQSPDIICHRGAQPGALSAKVAAGGTVKLTWNQWLSDHHGPVITYLANCNGDCGSVDKNTLEFLKSTPPVWKAAGNYVLRHEIIALHSAGKPQNYPQCVNLKVTGGGTAAPSGTRGTELYKGDEAGLRANIWNGLTSYVIPGPPLYTAGAGAGASTGSATTKPPVATTLAPSVTAVTSTTSSAKGTTSVVTLPIPDGQCIYTVRQ